MKDMDHGFGVDRISMRGRGWRVAQAQASMIDRLKEKGMNPVAARILASRGVTPETLDSFLNPRLRDLMPDPFFFLDMEKAVKRIARAVRDGERIGVWSDYDADGATSAAVMGRFLRMLGHENFVLRIPNRLTEGYGPNTPGLLDMAARQGCNLICILDAGIVAFEQLAAAKAAGIEVIVLDHHQAEDTVPEGVAIVDPSRKDQPAGYEHLCAAGLTFIFAVGVTRELKQTGWFDEGMAVPPLMSLLDVVALGTVCDVVPLKTVNRAFVYQGLKILNDRKVPKEGRNAGIHELAQVSGLTPEGEITEKDFGWKIGPRINAGGRIGNPLLGAEILMEGDWREASERAKGLDQLNIQRKQIQLAMDEAAIGQHAGRVSGVDRTLCLSIIEGHEGIVGITAGKVREAYDAPAIVLTEDHEGNLKGSARSVPGFDIGHAIIDARKAGLIIKGGGHGAAGGVTLTKAQVPGFIAFMNAEIAKTEYFRQGVFSEADLELALPDLTVKVIEGFEVLRPFGQGNSEPLLIVKNVEVADIKTMSDGKHLKVVIKDRGVFADAIQWNAGGSALHESLLQAKRDRIDVLGSPGINVFRGKKSVQLMMEDVRLSA